MEVAPQLAADSGADLQGLEGLGDIVVRSQVQPQHLVRVLAFGGEQDDRGVALLPDGGQGAQSVHDGHHDIQQDQLYLLPLQGLQGFLPVGGGEKLVIRPRQVDFQSGDDIGVVVADQDVGHSLLSPLAAIVLPEGIKKK